MNKTCWNISCNPQTYSRSYITQGWLWVRKLQTVAWILRNLRSQFSYRTHNWAGKFSSVTQSCPTLCNPMDYSTADLSIHYQFPEFTQTHVHPVDDAIQPSLPLLSPYPPTFNLSQHQGLFFNESVLRIRWPKYWSFSFNIPCNEYSGLISFRMDWFDLLAVQGTLKSLLQHHSQKHQLFGAQLSL